jgi:hypothetical protein
LGIDDDDDAKLEILNLHQKGLIEKFSSYEDVAWYLGAKPSISKVGVLEKISGGKIKRQVIVDSKRSGVSLATRKHERIVLPRVLDVVYDTLHQLSEVRKSRRHDLITEWFVLDFANAFFIVPLALEERRFFAIKLSDHYYVFKVQAQGAGLSPLIWGRVAALISRLTQCLFHNNEALLQTFG